MEPAQALSLYEDVDEIVPFWVGQRLTYVNVEALEGGLVIEGLLLLFRRLLVPALFLVFETLLDRVQLRCCLDSLAQGVVTVDNHVFPLGLISLLWPENDHFAIDFWVGVR